MSVSMETRGVNELVSSLRVYADQARRASARVIYEEAEQVMAISKDAYVPVVTGFLKSTGYVQPPDTSLGGEISVRLGYGAAYALKVHENPNAGRARGVGQWKFLEKPLMQAARGLSKRVAERVRELLR